MTRYLLFVLAFLWMMAPATDYFYAGRTSEGLGIGMVYNGTAVDSFRLVFYGYDASGNNTGSIKTAAYVDAPVSVSSNAFSLGNSSAGGMIDTGVITLSSWKIAGTFSSGCSGSSSYCATSSDEAEYSGTYDTRPGGVTWKVYRIGTTGEPPYPANISVTTLSTTSLRVSWDSVPGAYRYALIDTGGGISRRGSTFLGKFGSSVLTSSAISTGNQITADTLTGLAAGTCFGFTVVTVNAFMVSDESAVKTGCTLPSAPSTPSVSASSSTTTFVDWVATTGATSYIVSRSQGGAYVAIDTVASSYFYDSGLSPNVTYYYKVAARGTGGTGASSGAGSALTYPTSPVGSATALSQSGMRLAWASVSGGVRYRQYRSTSLAGIYALVDTTTNLADTVYGHSAGTSYWYKLRAVNSNGDSSAYSAAFTAMTFPATPIVPIVNGTTWFSTELTWTSATGATSYDVMRWNGAAWDSVANTSALVWNVDTGMVGSSSYYFLLRSRNSSGTSSGSWVMVTTPSDNATTMPFVDGFEAGTLTSWWGVHESDTSGRARSLSDGHAALGSYALLLDKSLPGGKTLNEVIVPIVVSYASDMDVSFLQKEVSGLDEDNSMSSSFRGHDTSEGVAFSTDGKQWYSLASFTGASSTSTWKRWNIDLDSSIAGRGLSSPYKVYLKFQQYDDYNSPSDGIYLDDVHVLPRPKITASAGAGGSISPSGTIGVRYDQSQSFTITPGVGYNALVTVDGVSQGSVASYAFTGVTANHTIAAVFSLKTYAISLSVGVNGAASPAAGFSVEHGRDTSIAFTPATGYHVDSVFLDGVYQGALNKLTIAAVNGAHSVRVAFARNQYTVMASASYGGTLNPLGSVSAYYGDDVALRILPDTAAGYEFFWATLDGAAWVTSGDTLLLPDVSASHTVAAYFRLRSYSISVVVGSGGSSSVVGSFALQHGSDTSMVFTPSTGYRIDTVYLDGVSQGAPGSLALENVKTAHSIAVVFARKQYPVSITSGVGGSSSPVGVVNVNHGDSLMVLIHPDSANGYEVSGLIVDGIAWLGNDDTVKLTAVTAGHSVQATYGLREWNVMSSAGAGGAVSPAGSVDASHGSAWTSVFFPSPGYEVDSIVVDGVRWNGGDTVRLDSLHANHSIQGWFRKLTFPITASAAANGTISSPGMTWVDYGMEKSYTITPSGGYAVDSVVVDGVSIGAANSYIFSGVDSAHSIQCWFRLAPTVFHDIVTAAGSGGVVSPAGIVSIGEGSDLSVQVIPSTGHRVDSVKVDGLPVGPVEDYMFSDITASHSLSAWFGLRNWVVTASAGVGGSVVPSGSIAVLHGANTTVSFLPSSGYEVDSIVLDGMFVGDSGILSLSAVNSDHILRVTFRKALRSISLTSTAGGYSLPTGLQLVSDGDSLVIRYWADTILGYRLDSVKTNGVLVPVSQDSLVLRNINADQSVQAFFGIRTYPLTMDIGQGGTSSVPTTTALRYGIDTSISFTPSIGYRQDSIFLDGAYMGKGSSIALLQVDTVHHIRATFQRKSYSITVSQVGNGTISTPAMVNVLHGDSLSIAFTPDSGWIVDSVLLDGLLVGKDSAIALNGILADRELRVVFSPAPPVFWVVESSGGMGGTVSPAGISSVLQGDSLRIVIAPEIGYRLDSLMVDGLSLDTARFHTFRTISAGHVLRATFEKVLLEMRVSASGQGIVSADTVVEYGDTVRLIWNAAQGWWVDSVYMDGLPVDSLQGFTIAPALDSHNLRVVFSPRMRTVELTGSTGGSVLGAGQHSLAEGDSLTVTCQPSVGFQSIGLAVGNDTLSLLGDSLVLGPILADVSGTCLFDTATFQVITNVVGVGSIFPAGNLTVKFGDSANFHLQTDSLHRLDSLYVNGMAVVTDSQFVLGPITSDLDIRAVFGMEKFPLRIEAGNGFADISSGDTLVESGDSMLTRWHLLPGWRLDSVLVDGEPVISDSVWNWGAIYAPHSLRLVASPIQYRIQTSISGEGTWPLPDTSWIQWGDSLRAIPDAQIGWKLDSVIANGIAIPPEIGLDLTPVTEDVNAVAWFSRQSFSVQVNRHGLGSVSPALSQAQFGDTVKIRIVPLAGYQIQLIMVDGESVPVVNELVLPAIASDVGVEVYFTAPMVDSIIAKVQIWVQDSQQVHGFHSFQVPAGADTAMAIPSLPQGMTLLSISRNGVSLSRTDSLILQDLEGLEVIRLVVAPRVSIGQFASRIPWYRLEGGRFLSAEMSELEYRLYDLHGRLRAQGKLHLGHGSLDLGAYLSQPTILNLRSPGRENSQMLPVISQDNR